MKTTLQTVSDTVFKELHPLEYSSITKCWRKRAILYDCFKTLEATQHDVYWGALTFDNEHDKTSIENKRKQAIRHLNKCFVAWVMVEEFGEDNGRYHIHFIAIFKRTAELRSQYSGKDHSLYLPFRFIIDEI